MKNSAVLLISCPDKKGIVASVSGFLYKHKANILESSQHQDNELGLFLMRVEWDLTDFNIDVKDFEKYFSPIARKFKMKWQLSSSNHKSKVAIFVSKEDHCLQDLLYRYKSGELNCEISLVISNHSIAKQIADFYKIPFYYIPFVIANEKNKRDRHSGLSRINEIASSSPKASSRNDEIMNKSEVEKEQLKLLKKHNVDLVILARYMQILSPDFIKSYPNNIINIHHSFLPAFIGAKPYHQAYKRGVKIIGVTSHYVNEELDNGPIIEQDVIRISHRDTVRDLVQKGKDLEKIVLSRAVKWHIENRILLYENKTVIFD